MYKIVKCPNCTKDEYYGMIYWLNGKTYCRSCIYKIWEEQTGRPQPGYTFPLYDDGRDYRIETRLEALADRIVVLRNQIEDIIALFVNGGVNIEDVKESINCTLDQLATTIEDRNNLVNS